MNSGKRGLRSLALLSIYPLLTVTAFAYDATWYKTDFWAGEYPHGFTLEQSVTTLIRTAPDPQAPMTITCTMKKGATYHPWNRERVASSKLEFISYVPTETYVIKKPATFTLRNEQTDSDEKITLGAGDEWTYMTYYAEGMFKMSFKGTAYTADQDLMEASLEKDTRASTKVRFVDEWMKLTCANGASGWLLLGDVLSKPAYGGPNFVEYGVAKDK